MGTILKSSDLSRQDLLQLLDALEVPQDDRCRIWAEAPDGWALDYWHGLAGNLSWYGSGRRATSIGSSGCLETAWAGRVFAPSGELRWREIQTLGQLCCRTVFLGNVDWTPGRLIDRSEVLQQLARRTERYLLWGQQSETSEDDWVELRIPHRFRYPLEAHSKGVRVVTELWSDDAGDLHFARLCDLEPYEEGD